MSTIRKVPMEFTPMALEFLLPAVEQAEMEIGIFATQIREAIKAGKPSPEPTPISARTPVTKPMGQQRGHRRKPVQRAKAAAQASPDSLPSSTREELILWARKHRGQLNIIKFKAAHNGLINPKYLGSGVYAMARDMEKRQKVFKYTSPGLYQLVKAKADKFVKEQAVLQEAIAEQQPAETLAATGD